MSEVKVNKISPRTNCGTVQLGDSGDTITIPAGATIVNNGTQTGFGRTGTVNWDTTAKTASFTAVSGNGYFVNTTSGAITVTLPATPSGGDIVSLADYTNTWDTNNVTVARNGSKIGGIEGDSTLSTKGQSVTFVYVDATEGWKNVQDSTSNVIGDIPFIIATGGTITTCGNCKIHTFTGPGTFTVCSVATVCGPTRNQVSYIVVAGGASGGKFAGGGGGAGGYREVKTPLTPYTASPLDGYPSAPNRITVTETNFPITVGGGGAAITGCTNGNPGSVSTFSTITSAGGGGGGGTYNTPGIAGGSGGGGAGGNIPVPGGSGAAGNTPPVSPPQGQSGGNGFGPTGQHEGGGGGGAGGTGANGSAGVAGPGGTGSTSSINGTPTTRAGGGGGAIQCGTTASGGAGGGGDGGRPPCSTAAQAGTDNTGGGGGGAAFGPRSSGAGGSGIVIIRYKYQ